jgi:hypothetical protein
MAQELGWDIRLGAVAAVVIVAVAVVVVVRVAVRAPVRGRGIGRAARRARRVTVQRPWDWWQVQVRGPAVVRAGRGTPERRGRGHRVAQAAVRRLAVQGCRGHVRVIERAARVLLEHEVAVGHERQRVDAEPDGALAVVGRSRLHGGREDAWVQLNTWCALWLHLGFRLNLRAACLCWARLKRMSSLSSESKTAPWVWST